MDRLQAGNIIKFAVFLIILVLIAYNLGQKVVGPQLKKINIGKNPTPTSITATADLTVNWLSYKDPTGYSLKYPTNLTVQKINGNSVQIDKLKIEIKEQVKVPAGDKITIGSKEAVWTQNNGLDVIYLPFPDNKKILVATKPMDDKGSENTLFRIIDSIRF